MDCDPQKPAIIKLFIGVSERDIANNDFGANHPGLEDFGGYFGWGTTQASGVSGSIVSSYHLTFTHSSGVVPSEELYLAQVNKLLEQQQEITKR